MLILAPMDRVGEVQVAARREGPPDFDAAFRERLYDLLKWRRDVRRFQRVPLPEGAVERLIGLACLSPSVGLSEPWRFVIVADDARRAAIRHCFEAATKTRWRCRRPTAPRSMPGSSSPASTRRRARSPSSPTASTAQGAGLGRLTMPEALDYSVAIAIHSFWLAARAEGIGVGWVSILDAGAHRRDPRCAARLVFIGHLCVGYPLKEDDLPALEREGWEHRRAPNGVVLYR